MKRILTLLSCGLVSAMILLSAWSTSGQTPVNATAMSNAEKHLAAQEWAKAIAAFEAITQSDPMNGRAWNRLGFALHQSGQYQRATLAFRQAVDRGLPIATYNLACSYAKLNDKDQSYTWLRRALESRLPAAAGFQNDPDLSILREDARYSELVTLADQINQPCLHQPEYRQFDFWVGEWEVRSEQGQLLGTSRIELSAAGCVVLENWTGAKGGSGRSLNYFDSATRKWHQTWVGSQGGIVQLDGVYTDGALRYTGTTSAGNGQKTLERLTFFNLGSDRVRQVWEQSTDEGRTWKVAFDGYYSKRKSQ